MTSGPRKALLNAVVQ